MIKCNQQHVTRVHRNNTIAAGRRVTYAGVLEDGYKEILARQQVLEMIYERDPLIKKSAEKLDRLSQDPEVVRR